MVHRTSNVALLTVLLLAAACRPESNSRKVETEPVRAVSGVAESHTWAAPDGVSPTAAATQALHTPGLSQGGTLSSDHRGDGDGSRDRDRDRRGAADRRSPPITPPDTSPPTTPSNLAAEASSEHSVSLRWELRAMTWASPSTRFAAARCASPTDRGRMRSSGTCTQPRPIATPSAPSTRPATPHRGRAGLRHDSGPHSAHRPRRPRLGGARRDRDCAALELLHRRGGGARLRGGARRTRGGGCARPERARAGPEARPPLLLSGAGLDAAGNRSALSGEALRRDADSHPPTPPLQWWPAPPRRRSTSAGRPRRTTWASNVPGAPRQGHPGRAARDDLRGAGPPARRELSATGSARSTQPATRRPGAPLPAPSRPM